MSLFVITTEWTKTQDEGGLKMQTNDQGPQALDQRHRIKNPDPGPKISYQCKVLYYKHTVRTFHHHDYEFF